MKLRAVAALAVIGALVGLAIDPRFFLISYLEGYLIVLGMGLGCLGIWMLHNLVGGQWGDPIGSVVRASAGTLPLLALLFLPVLFGMRTLFPWTDTSWMQKSEVLSQKLWYLSPPFFIARSVGYFGLWLFLLRGVNARSNLASPEASDPTRLRLENWSAGGVLALFFSGSQAAIDWVLTLEPYFYSTVWGALVLMGQLLGAFAFCTAAALFLHARGRGKPEIPAPKLGDLGNLLLMSIVFWIYLAFSQYLIIWSGQIRAEASYYNARFVGGWQWLGGALLVFNFALPLLCLLFRPIKRHPRRLAVVAGVLLVMQWVMAVWLVGPAFSPGHCDVGWQTVVVPAALGLVWLCAVGGRLERGVPELTRGHAQEVADYAA
jgi:hypothetical protein